MSDEAREPLAPDGAGQLPQPDAWPARPGPPPRLRDHATALATRHGLTWARAAIGVLVVVGVSTGAWWLLRPPAPPIEQSLPAAAEASATGPTTPAPGTASTTAAVPGGATTTTAPAQVVVHAAGAVVHPGVYRLPGTARVDDLVRAAGGLAPRADANRVNLAAPVADGQRVYVPAAGEQAVPAAVTGDPGGSTSSGGPGSGPTGPPGGGPSPPGTDGEPDAPVDLNAADAAALDTLPGVGPATAEAIIAYREEHGPFRSVDELLEVRGIGDAKLAELRDRVTVGG